MHTIVSPQLLSQTFVNQRKNNLSVCSVQNRENPKVIKARRSFRGRLGTFNETGPIKRVANMPNIIYGLRIIDSFVGPARQRRSERWDHGDSTTLYILGQDKPILIFYPTSQSIKSPFEILFAKKNHSDLIKVEPNVYSLLIKNRRFS